MSESPKNAACQFPGGRLRWPALAAAFALLAPTVQGQTNVFGFTGPEIFPLDNQLCQLHAADVNGDGLNDIISIGN